MISFKDFLIESRSAPLYHATPIGNLSNILKNGIISSTYQVIYRGRNRASAGRYGISLTRNMRNADWYMQNQYMDDDYVVLELDQRAINNRYKIIPVDYFETQSLMALGNERPTKPVPRALFSRKEAEEFVVVPQKWDGSKSEYIGSLSSKYIKNIHYFTNRSEEYMRVLNHSKARNPSYNWVARK